MGNNESEHVADLVSVADKGAVTILTFMTDDGKQLDVSAFAGLPPLQEGSKYRLRTTQNEKNGRTYTNLVKGNGSYLIEKIAEPPRAAPPQPAPRDARAGAAGVKIDAREVRISRLSCTSSACLVVASWVEKGKIDSIEGIDSVIVNLARKLEAHALSSE